jgi:hypothetical protein
LSSFSRNRDREQLERELGTQAYEKLLKDLQRASPFLRQFAAWTDVIAFMRAGTSDDPRKDEILRPILAANAAFRDPRWRTILLVIFWPGLLSLHLQKRHWDEDPDELWDNLTWTFLKILPRIDVTRRPDRLVQKVINDTAHHLHDEYRRNWDRLEREENLAFEQLESLAASDEIDPLAIFLDREEEKKAINRLREHVDAGRITEIDLFLIVSTRVYGKQVADCARELGLAYQAAKKRRQRAEEAIRRFYEEFKKW